MLTGRDLGLTATGENTGGGCACCAYDAAPQTADAATASITADYLVDGMTCAHCVSSVTEELSELAGVTRVDVELGTDAPSRVRVSSDAPLDADAVRAAIEEAGYTLAQS